MPFSSYYSQFVHSSRLWITCITYLPQLSLILDLVFKAYGQCPFPPFSNLLPDSRVRLPERGSGGSVDELAAVLRGLRHAGFLQPCLGLSGIF